MLRQIVGQKAERKAEAFLKKRGLIRLERNYNCRMGEIDLVMRDGEAIVFVEVRKRSLKGYGDAADSINTSKQRKLVLAARHFLMNHSHYGECPCRFDVVAIDGETETIKWISNAFEA